MKKLSKSDVKKAVVGALVPVMLDMQLKKPSKKIRRAISKLSKQIMAEKKRQDKDAANAGKKVRKSSKPAKGAKTSK